MGRPEIENWSTSGRYDATAPELMIPLVLFVTAI